MMLPVRARSAVSVALILGIFALCCNADEAVPANPSPRWWKGNIHTHTFWSDGNDFPEMVAEWYRSHDYNFLALSDHNVLSEGIRWMPLAEIVRRGGDDVVDKYRARFGEGWVETRGGPEQEELEIRLKPLNEFRALVEERGRFIMIQGEEISDSAEGKPVHLNATNLKELVPPLGGATVREAVINNLRAVEEQAKATGREILLHLNHPNFGLAFTAEDLAAVISERFFEVYNGHPGVLHTGDEHHPSVERLWDIANTIRLDQLHAPPLFGVATDDSHEYHGRPGSHTGRGWIMVRSRYLTPEYLIRAIRAGEFYASSGITLNHVRYEKATGTLELEINPSGPANYTTEFIGTLADYDTASSPRTDNEGKPIATTRKYSEDIGRVLATVEGLNPRYQLTGDELYVRAVVTSNVPHEDPSFANQYQQAWTQPVGWDRRLNGANTAPQ